MGSMQAAVQAAVDKQDNLDRVALETDILRAQERHDAEARGAKRWARRQLPKIEETLKESAQCSTTTRVKVHKIEPLPYLDGSKGEEFKTPRATSLVAALKREGLEAFIDGPFDDKDMFDHDTTAFYVTVRIRPENENFPG